MTDNILQTLQQLVQDVIAPDVRELKVRLTSFEKEMDGRFNAVDQRFTSLTSNIEQRFAAVDQRFAAIDQRFDSLSSNIDQRFASLDQKSDARFKAVLAAIAGSKAQTELTNMRFMAALSERVDVLEAQRH